MVGKIEFVNVKQFTNNMFLFDAEPQCKEYRKKYNKKKRNEIINQAQPKPYTKN